MAPEKPKSQDQHQTRVTRHSELPGGKMSYRQYNADLGPAVVGERLFV
jgi:hypothetical protein